MDRTTFEALRDLPGKTISGDIRARLAGHTLVRDIEAIRTGPIRIETAFIYPDGSSIDLFLVEDVDPVPALRVSDLAQTSAWLLDVQIEPWLSPKRQALLDDVLRVHQVRQQGGELVRDLDSLDDLVPTIVSLGQACVRIADLMFTKSPR